MLGKKSTLSIGNARSAQCMSGPRRSTKGVSHHGSGKNSVESKYIQADIESPVLAEEKNELMKIEIPWETSNKDSASERFDENPETSGVAIRDGPETQEQSFEEEVFSGSRTRVHIRTDESLS